MLTRAPHWLCCLFLLPGLSACQSQPPAEAGPLRSTPQTVAAEAEQPKSDIKPEDVDVTVVHDAATLHQALEALKGKTVMVNFWAVWCPTCLEEFPDLVAAWQAVEDQDVVLVTVNGDFPEDLDPKVKPFLAEHGVKDHAFMTDVEDDVKFINAFGFGFDGTFPSTLTFDKSGALVELHPGEAKRADFDAMWQKALAAGEQQEAAQE